MNARVLKKQSATNWARIDQMTDEETDTSDVPPLDNAFFAEAEWRLPRLYIDLNDLRQARKFVDYILKQGLHNKKRTELARARQELVHLAFNTSLIISYSRPFHFNKNLKGQPESSLRKQAVQVLNEPEVEMHSRILTMRDTTYAHSAARSHLIEDLDYRKSVGLMRSVQTLNKNETSTLKIMIKKWIGFLEIEKSKLKESLRRHRTP